MGMKWRGCILKYIDKADFQISNTCVAFGNFDGVHVGHPQPELGAERQCLGGQLARRHRHEVEHDLHRDPRARS